MEVPTCATVDTFVDTLTSAIDISATAVIHCIMSIDSAQSATLPVLIRTVVANHYWMRSPRRSEGELVNAH